MSNVQLVDSLQGLELSDEDVQVFHNTRLSSEVQQELANKGYDVVIFDVHREALAQAAQLEDDDEKDWNPTGRQYLNEKEEERDKARFLSKYNAFFRRALKLYKMYVFGSGFDITLKPFYLEDDPPDSQKEKDKKIIKQANRAWGRFLEHNKKWWTPDELGVRTWRDGEQFSVKRKSDDSTWPPELRFIDPEEIDDPKSDDPSNDKNKRSFGIGTDPKDVNTVLYYQRIDVETQKEIQKFSPDKVFHSKIDVDSTEKRGMTRFLPVIKWIKRLDALVSNEVTHRSLQSSIVLVRKVSGGSSSARGLLNNARTGSTQYVEQTMSREKIRPGSIITVSNGTDLEFVTPNSSFSDATPLVKVLIIYLSAATGWTYSMLTTDASDGSFASSLTAESPVLQMVLDERKMFREELVPIFKWVIESAIKSKQIEGVTVEEVWEKFDPEFHYGDIVSRDNLKDAQAANIGVMSGALSKAEGARRMNADPDKMKRELEDEADNDVMSMIGVTTASNPKMQDKQDSSKSNATNGGGKNQSDDPVSHKDKL